VSDDETVRRLLEGIEVPNLPVAVRCPDAQHEYTDATVLNRIGEYVSIFYCVKCATWGRFSV
jgi:hypothetical protein